MARISSEVMCLTFSCIVGSSLATFLLNPENYHLQFTLHLYTFSKM
jgi:hypothetical protein